jgi:hypothetical protein
LGRGRRKHANKRAALRDAVRVASMRCDFADDIVGAGEADGDFAAAVERSSEKVSKIAKRSREKAYQNMAGAKCKCLAVQSAQVVGATKWADVLALGLKHQCECGEPFASVAGLATHQRDCYAANKGFETDETRGEQFDIEALLDVWGPEGRRF